MPQATPLMPGDPEHLGAYELTGRLGEGGQGIVYLGVRDGTPVAVKQLHARLSWDPKARSRFAAEVAVAQRVSPFCTARILDADVDVDTPYIVSEYIDGPSLQDVVAAEGPRTGPALHRLAIGTITALTAIHQAGIVHRDFKPSNVLLAADGPRVIDFGIARALDATGTLSSTTIGTPAYMAPEQISGTAIGPAADVFAWGCIIAFAAGGRPPFGLDSIPAVMNRIVNLPPDLSRLSPPLHDIVAGCLAKDPSARPTAQAVLLRLLGHAGAAPQGAQAVLTEGAQAAAPSAAPSAAAAPPAGAASAGGPSAGPAAGPALGPPPAPPPMAAPMPAPPNVPPPYRPLGSPYAPAPQRTTGRPSPAVLAMGGTAAFVALVLIGVSAFIQLRPSGEAKRSPTPVAPRYGGTLTMGLSYAPTNIDPSSATYGPGVFIAKQLFTGLTEIDPDGRVVRRLARELRPDAGCRNWTITVEPGTTFSNGEPVDPQSFVRGWNRAAKTQDGDALFVMDTVKGYQEVYSGKADTLSGVTATATSLQVELTGPDCEFDRRLAAVPFSPVPASAGDIKNTSYNNRPIGNGPFIVQSYSPNARITLARNDRWFAGKARLDRVDVNLANAAISGFDSGQYDWVPVGTQELATAKSRHGNDQQLLTRRLNGLDFVAPVTARGPLSNKLAREAVSYAIDRQALSQTLFGGVRSPATGLVSDALPGYQRSGICPSCERPDQQKAKQLAAAAGLPAGSKVTLVFRKESSTTPTAEAIAERLESVLGWQIARRTFELSDYNGFGKALTGRNATGLGPSGWISDFASAYNLLHTLLGADQTAKVSDWRNPQFDQLLDQAVTTNDETKRRQLIQQAEKIALDDLAVIPLWANTESALANTKKFTNLRIDLDGDPTLATAALK